MTASDTTSIIHSTTIAHKGSKYQVPTGLFINNQFVPSISGRTFPSTNPATGKVFLEFCEADKADVDVAVAAAKAALKGWQMVPSPARGVLMWKLADLIEKNAKELAELESLDNGKPVGVAFAADLPLTVACLRYYAGWSDKNTGQLVDATPTQHTFTRHEPIGVVGQIIPWNFPLLMLAWKLGPALACGNVVIVKTSEKTPLTALKVAELIVEAGFPPGVVNILSGYGPTAGDAIARHLDISKVAFTGSTVTGRKVAIAAAESNLKKVTLELGGKSPNIIFPDADLDSAIKFASMGIFFNAGQCCCAGSRVFVHEDVYDEFVSKFEKSMAAVKTGDPFDANNDQGAIVDKLQYDRVLSYIDIGRQEGARVISGATPLGSDGYFIAPTLITDVKDSMRISKEEIFGPVVCVLKFKTVEEVLERANNSTYGLAAGVHTKDIRTALRMSNELKAGTVWVNQYNAFHAQMPFGGFKESGVGRELGQYALAEYSQIKSVMINLA
ncbi:hypothetical protein BASA50_009744 [Batrachochytrium salamandrivorans]|uniref:Aldehyde dehydrogenase domain-containing protein n=1 Tax=Batrachochytrium salamandrivorans TaxID=1357716 RepID=A0ABQ8F0R7_9FUNG|nr:hypothetical protein BASA62_004671 [Batrachochytrium salamandrivorans]KAH6570972.1 hypothetical protein BASA60_007401 [Batrachochytrium salamandrivorans]KAH6590042.1 hypothetical protein BASA50_009744 [Batrachochytrium salamandrivorans]KAH6592323.1 hypothetical protein BASA61_004646 [Batrachochytrium salamandrivorans]KAH9252639.1 hypothetical protein BASA81_009419 [Batrachochytrium salamandrivorans]